MRSTTLPAILSVCLLVAFNASRVESRYTWNTMFVFGDSFVDTGNLPEGQSDHVTEMTRQWHFPYGASQHGPTGRFSDGLVQSDFIAKILGHRVGPPAYAHSRKHSCHPYGMTFATGGAGVYKVPHSPTVDPPTLGQQVDRFQSLLKDGSISKRHLNKSVGLVAVSGNDYARVANMSNFSDIVAFIGNVTTEIVNNVQQLQKFGVTKILVNNMHPVGCTPWQTRSNNYTACDARGNMGASVHNNNLKQKLGRNENVLILDLNTAFTNLVNPAPGSLVSKKFPQKLRPCCESIDPKGFCAQLKEDWEADFTIYSDPSNHFYWDDVHPTQGGWEAVMKQLQEPIKKFLGLENRF